MQSATIVTKVRQLVLQSAITLKRCHRTQRSILQNHNVFAIEGIRVEKGDTCNLSQLLFTLSILLKQQIGVR